MHPQQIGLATPLSLPPPLVHCSPKGFPQCVINFTFSVCRRVERRLRPSSRPARPRGHQLKALIGQQYIKVAPRSGSSEHQESVSWALFQIEKYRREKKNEKRKSLGEMWSAARTPPVFLGIHWLILHILRALCMERTIFVLFLCSEATLLTSP